VTPPGNQVLVANYWPPEIVTFPRNPDGTVEADAGIQTNYDARPGYFALHPVMPLVYWTEIPGGSVVTGVLSGGSVDPLDMIFSGFGADELVIDAAGAHLYVLNNNDDDVSVFDIDGSGDLSLAELEPTSRRPEHLVLHPDGDFLYVASAGDAGGLSTISVYAVASDGELTEVFPRTFAPQGVYRLAIVDLSP
jgi:DNA-binding beta-propeller fold protein YncE